MLVERFSENPLIMCGDVKASREDYEVVGAFNAGAVRYGDEVILLVRVAERPKEVRPDEEVAPILVPEKGQIRLLHVKHSDSDYEVGDSRVFYYKGVMYLTSISHLRLARSADGRRFEIDPEPTIFPEGEYETFGIEDARITQIGDDFYITYKLVSEHGICTGLMKTQDFTSFERMGIIFCPENLDVVIFPERIGDKYWALTRPVPCNLGAKSIWAASSPDLIHWGGHEPVIVPRAGQFDAGKVGASCVPIKTPDGWLEIYHGSDEQDRYSLGAALLDLENPCKVLAQSKEPLMQPEADYEVKGFYDNVVFACGAVFSDDGVVDIYYGASDESTAGARTTVEKIMSTMQGV